MLRRSPWFRVVALALFVLGWGMSSAGTLLADAWRSAPAAAAHVEGPDAAGTHVGGHADDCALCQAWQVSAAVATAGGWPSVGPRPSAAEGRGWAPLPDGRHRPDEARGPPARG